MRLEQAGVVRHRQLGPPAGSDAHAASLMPLCVLVNQPGREVSARTRPCAARHGLGHPGRPSDEVEVLRLWQCRSGLRQGRELSEHAPVTRPPFDVDAFLAQPLTARVAASGPTVRPTWYLWEDEAFWILTGPWATLAARVRADPAVAIVVDVCDLATGLVRQVIARGRAELLPFDVARGRRKLRRYLGVDEARWDDRFRHYLLDDPAEKGTVWLRLRPDSLVVSDLSYSVWPSGGDG
jgi:Pyridoxamine 5'-phosphate oxidase